MQPEQEKDPLEEIDIELDDQPKPRHTRTGRRPGGKKRLILIAVTAVTALALIGGAAFWWLVMREPKKEPVASETSNQQNQPTRQAPNLTPAEAAQLTTFKSDKLKIELQHRRDWTAQESADKTELVLSSPPVGYQTKDGSVPDTQGVFTLKIRMGAVEQAAQETINGAAAVRDSEIIAYADPTEAQRHYTNISYAGQDGHLQFFIVSGSTAYKTEDILASTLPLSSPDYFLIAGGFGEDTDGALAFDLVPATEINSEVFKQAIAIVESLKLY